VRTLYHQNYSQIRTLPFLFIFGLAFYTATSAWPQDNSALQSVTLTGDQAGKELTANFSRATSLKQLKLDRASLSDESLNLIASFPALEELSLEECEFSDQLLPTLIKSPKLKRLRLRAVHLTDGGLARLQELSQLELLEIHECSGFSERGLQGVGKLLKLRSLTLSGSSINDSVVLQLKDLTNLTALALRHTKVSSSGFRILERFTKLKELDVFGTAVSSDFLMSIPNPANLTKLKLRASGLTSMALVEFIARFENATLIDLGENEIDDAALASISQLGKLEDLNLLRTKISNKGVRSLSKMKLKKLNLDDIAGVDDESIDELRLIETLEFLHLGKTKVTDVGIAKLVQLGQLKTLILNDTQVTTEGIKKLQLVLPNLRIVR